ncbi:Hypothetical predicted protein [Paramuricea clavata]|uniref:Uncharacterized protein n=1 Tax=Paramuricea clavata TaxID=317549 RepID=A0A7D9HNX6_PARCT|nr:Hypothetical predicted protein [Paramuricea clavata]
MRSNSTLCPENNIFARPQDPSKRTIVEKIDTHESLDKVIETQIQPAIVMAGDLYQADVMYVVAEGAILVDIKSRKIVDALVALLATYYMYNVEQKVGKNVFCFLDMVLMGIVPPKCPAYVKTLIGVLSNM